MSQVAESQCLISPLAEAHYLVEAYFNINSISEFDHYGEITVISQL